MKFRNIAIASAVAALTFTAQAQDVTTQAQDVSSSPLAAVYACADIAGDSARLACYDQAVGRLQEQELSQEFVAIDKQSAEKLNREAFGFTLPSLPKLKLFSGEDKKKDDDSIDLAVKSVSKRHSGITLIMENGQVWRSTGGRLNYIPKGDLTARISRGAIGSYKLSLSNGKDRVRGLKVKRVE